MKTYKLWNKLQFLGYHSLIQNIHFLMTLIVALDLFTNPLEFFSFNELAIDDLHVFNFFIICWVYFNDICFRIGMLFFNTCLPS